MKNMYAWVPWFRELAGRIAEGGEQGLIERAKHCWKGQDEPPLVKDFPSHLDPLSFLYFLTTQEEEIFAAVGEAFGMGTQLWEEDDAWIFPQTMAVNPLFLHRNELDPKPMWSLFRAAHRTEQGEVQFDSDLWDAVLANPGVGVPSLTQMLCLANPYAFLALDKKNMEIVRAILRSTDSIEGRIRSRGYTEYASIQAEMCRHFPKCHLYEIDRFLYLQHKNRQYKEPLLNKKPTIFQVNTHVYGEQKGDHWAHFESENTVFTGGPTSETGKTVYPLGRPKRGDVVVVRTGAKRGRGIGVVVKNDFNDKGWYETGRIHVIWINKEEHILELTQKQINKGAFSEAPPALLSAFRTPYRPSFRLIETLTPPDAPVGDQELPTPLGNDSTTEGGNLLNQILYGPPGTGKTWNTVARSVAIVEGKDVETVEKERKDQPDEVKRRFDLAREAGQVAMVTFHQNYAYEDFVEGIRPTVEDASAEGVGYVLRPGVFREMVERAAQNLRTSQTAEKDAWTSQEVVQGFLEWIRRETASSGAKRLGKGAGGRDILVSGVYESRDGDIAGVQLGGTTNQKLFRRVLDRDYRAFRDGGITEYTEIGRTRPGSSTWHGQAVYFFELLKMVRKYHKDVWRRPERKTTERRNFVLILDEINRGNIARIFGELITLVEESRRIGRRDETKVTLPYSGDEFGVPENLYLVGTMNTADRSIALLDTALRRRFEFVEMMPDSSLLDREVAEVDLGSLLDAMNGRIRFLRDREHQIGHTYFLEVSDLEGLRKVFQDRILPLLQEYFYDDWAKIEAVLGNNGFVESVDPPPGLAGGDLLDVGAKSYELLPFDDEKWGESASYRKIYEKPARGGANDG